MSFNRWMDQEIVVRPHSVVPLSRKKELQHAAWAVEHTAKGMDQDHYTEWKMQAKKAYPCTIPFMHNSRKCKLICDNRRQISGCPEAG